MDTAQFTENLAMGISYRGSAYCGWQRQRHRSDTVQETLEAAISRVANAPTNTICAGRTDSGVHASGQVIHVNTAAKRSDYGWQMGINTHLPADIRVDWVRVVGRDFHARFSANYRRYQYIIEDSSVGNAVFAGLITPYKYSLDAGAMHDAAQCLLGEHDFSSFRAAHCQSNTPFRHIDHLRVGRHQQFVVIDIQSNAFLYHMVRNIVGALLLIGNGKRDAKWLEQVFNAKDRRKAPATAAADGLYLVEVGYNEAHQLPIDSNTLPFVTVMENKQSE